MLERICGNMKYNYKFTVGYFFFIILHLSVESCFQKSSDKVLYQFHRRGAGAGGNSRDLTAAVCYKEVTDSRLEVTTWPVRRTQPIGQTSLSSVFPSMQMVLRYAVYDPPTLA